jgi:hypothetical protein
MLYRKHHNTVLKLVQPVEAASLPQDIEIGHKHIFFRSFTVEKEVNCGICSVRTPWIYARHDAVPVN